MQKLRPFISKVLTMCLALAMLAASLLLLVPGSRIISYAQPLLASGISSVIDYYVPRTDPWGTVTTVTPRLVTPKAISGSPGAGPQVIFSPTPVPGGKPGSQQIVLGDRTLIVTSVSKQNGPGPNSILISLNLAVQNTSTEAIMNQPVFFQLTGYEGDIFGFQYNSSDNFYGEIAAHATRNGIIAFQIPRAATPGLSLLYRPEMATETAIILLKIS